MMAELSTLIVDDEPLAVERLQILCARHPELRIVGTALRLIEALRPDLLLLDISMPGLDGLEVARTCAAQRVRPAIIFVTAYDQFAVAAFDVAAVDYLMKPVIPERLEQSIRRLARRAGGGAAPAATSWLDEFWVPHRHEVIRIRASDIDVIEAERDYMRIHVGARSFLLHQTISDLEQKLDPAMFIRIHRSTILRKDSVSALLHETGGSWSAQLADGRQFRVGATYLAKARELTGR
jgi:two-component system response regulator AlgR